MARPLHEVRSELREWLADLEALRPFSDPDSEANRAFTEAWKAAHLKASAVANEYALLVSASP